MKWPSLFLLTFILVANGYGSAAAGAELKCIPENSSFVSAKIANNTNEKGGDVILTLSELEAIVGQCKKKTIDVTVSDQLRVRMNLDRELVGKKVLLLITERDDRFLVPDKGFPLLPKALPMYLVSKRDGQLVQAIRRIATLLTMKDVQKRNSELTNAVKEKNLPLFLRVAVVREVGYRGTLAGVIRGFQSPLREWRDDETLPSGIRLAADNGLVGNSAGGYLWSEGRVDFLVGIMKAKDLTKYERALVTHELSEAKRLLAKRIRELQLRLERMKTQTQEKDSRKGK